MAGKVCIVILACVAMSHAAPWGDGGHKHIKISVPYHVHTVHHHHIEKYPVYKKIEVPVVKEVKVPFPVHYPIKVPYPVIVKPHVVTVPVEHYPVHSTEHHYSKHNSGEHHDHSQEISSHSGSSGYSGEGISSGYGGGHHDFAPSPQLHQPQQYHQQQQQAPPQYHQQQQQFSAPSSGYSAPSQTYPYPPPSNGLNGWMPSVQRNGW